MSGAGLLAGATVTIDDASEAGAWAEAIPSLPSQQQPVDQGERPPMSLGKGSDVRERFALSVMLRQRRLMALKLAERAAPGTEEAAIYADRVRQCEILTDEIEAGLHIDGKDV